MAERIAVVTANFANFDQLRTQQAQDLDVDWICFTDDPELKAPEPWRVELEDGRGSHPCLAAKRFKLLPPVPHRFVVWLDANMEITSPTFVREALAAIHGGIALHAHPRRDCIYDEAEACLGHESQNGKYAGIGVEAQVAHYRRAGHPAHAGLYACGTIAWDRANGDARRLGFHWLSECSRWTFQDQLSFPVLCRQLGIAPGVFGYPQLERRFYGANYIGNRYLRIYNHLK